MKRKIYHENNSISPDIRFYCYDDRKEGDTNEIEQHIPNFCSVDSSIDSFNTTDELLKIPFVKEWAEAKHCFDYYAMSGNHLMAIQEQGNKWWVIGTVKYPDKVDLPRIKFINDRAIKENEIPE